MRLKITTLVLLFFLPLLTFAQEVGKIVNAVSGEEIDVRDFVVATSLYIKEPETYAFGMSESEWSMTIVPYNDSFVVQCRFGEWLSDKTTGAATAWVYRYYTFNKGYQKGNTLSFGRFKCIFGTLKTEGETIKTALLNGDVLGDSVFKNDIWDQGDFFQAESGYAKDTIALLSQKIVSVDFFKGLDAKHLSILRNSLYARYGYIFKKGGEAEAYFIKRGGYYPRFTDVSKFFTTIELKNIATIKHLESSLKP